MASSNLEEEEEKIISKFKVIGQILRQIKRGIEGLPPEDDPFQGLIRVKSTIERARVSRLEQYNRTYMRLLGIKGKQRVFVKMANLLDRYSIGLDGKQWLYAVEIAKKQQAPPTTLVALGDMGHLREPQQKKKGFLGRNKKEETGEQQE